MPNRPDDLVVSVEPRNDGGASPLATGPSQVEPVPVSPLRASVPSAEKCTRCNGTGTVHGMMEDAWGASYGSWPCERGCRQ